MGGMIGLPGMPGSKGLESRGALSKGGSKPPMIGSYKSNLGAGFNKNTSGAPSGSVPSGLNAFNVPKYGSGGGIGGGIGLGGGLGMGSQPSLGLGENRSGNSRSSNRAGSGMGRHKY